MNTLEQALMRDGRAVSIDRLETEVLENGRFRWKLWSESELIYCAVGRREEIASMLKASEVILNAMSGVYNDEEKSRPGPATKGDLTRNLRRSNRRDH